MKLGISVGKVDGLEVGSIDGTKDMKGAVDGGKIGILLGLTDGTEEGLNVGT